MKKEFSGEEGRWEDRFLERQINGLSALCQWRISGDFGRACLAVVGLGGCRLKFRKILLIQGMLGYEKIFLRRPSYYLSKSNNTLLVRFTYDNWHVFILYIYIKLRPTHWHPRDDVF